jgi:hypothetical protein
MTYNKKPPIRTDSDTKFSDCYSVKMGQLLAGYRTTNKLSAAQYDAAASSALWDTGC